MSDEGDVSLENREQLGKGTLGTWSDVGGALGRGEPAFQEREGEEAREREGLAFLNLEQGQEGLSRPHSIPSAV